MAETYVMCQHCKRIFLSPLAFGNEQSFIMAKVIPFYVTCPACYIQTLLSKKNMIWRGTNDDVPRTLDNRWQQRERNHDKIKMLGLRKASPVVD